jgi:hypothetical protein
MRARRGEVSNHPEVADAMLVALASIDDYIAGISQIPDYQWTDDKLWEFVMNPTVPREAPDELKIVVDTIKEHITVFHDAWPPPSDEVKFVRGLAQGIHLT